MDKNENKAIIHDYSSNVQLETDEDYIYGFVRYNGDDY